MVGRTADQLHGVSVLDLVAPDMVELARKAHGALGLQPGRTMRLETRLMCADGRELPVQVTASQVAESPEGMAADQTFGDEIERFRKAPGARLCELTKFAFDTSSPARPRLAALFHIIFIYGSMHYDCTDLFIEVTEDRCRRELSVEQRRHRRPHICRGHDRTVADDEVRRDAVPSGVGSGD